jgi:hypothetical protein
MSYASVIGQQMIVPSKLDFAGITQAGTLQTVYTTELDGTYGFSCIIELDGQGPNEDADMRVGNLTLVEYPNVADFTRTLTGVAQTGTFSIKQKYRDATNYFIRLQLVKLT